MTIAQLQLMRPDIRKFMEEFQQLQLKISIRYAMEYAPEMMQLWPKVVEANQKILNQKASIAEFWNTFTMDEMIVLAKALRYTMDEMTTEALKKHPLPADIQLEKISAGGVPSEFQSPPGVPEERVMLFFHGGGMVIGSIHDHRPLSAALGVAANMRVLSVGYRLAPENPFPAGVEDCTSAYEWLLTQGYKPENIIVAGDSAGGLMSLAMAHNLKFRGTALPRGIVCMSPAVDFSVMLESAYTNAPTDPMLADAGLFWWITAYLGVENPADTANPLVSPLLGDFHGFPPMLVQATPCEILFEGSRMLVEKALDAGVDAKLQTWDGMIHVWQLYMLDELKEAREAIDSVGNWLRNLFK